jgi:hypothetical protein
MKSTKRISFNEEIEEFTINKYFTFLFAIDDFSFAPLVEVSIHRPIVSGI